jgi:hypothetical protein
MTETTFGYTNKFNTINLEDCNDTLNYLYRNLLVETECSDGLFLIRQVYIRIRSLTNSFKEEFKENTDDRRSFYLKNLIDDIDYLNELVFNKTTTTGMCLLLSDCEDQIKYTIQRIKNNLYYLSRQRLDY